MFPYFLYFLYLYMYLFLLMLSCLIVVDPLLFHPPFMYPQLPQLTAEVVTAAAAADAAERRSARAEGRDPKCGPPIRPRANPQQSRDPPEILDDDP